MSEQRLFEGKWINGIAVKGVRVNPRWEAAQFEYRWMGGLPRKDGSNFIPQAWPTRFETEADVYAKKAVPFFLIELEDGTTVESF